MITYWILVAFIAAVRCVEDYDYYWRDYEGYIPYDAVSGGFGIYIGQHIRQCYLTPGTLYPENKTFVGEYWGKFENTSDIKILCSGNHGQFKWVTIENSTDVSPEEPNCKLVPGGYEHSNFNFRWFIGRAFHEDMWKISKVDFVAIKGLSMWKNDGTYEHLTNFELLKICRQKE